MEAYLLPIPFVILGGIVVWAMIFLATYPHFPRMEKTKRIQLSIRSATIMAVVAMVILLVSIYFVMGMIFK